MLDTGLYMTGRSFDLQFVESVQIGCYPLVKKRIKEIYCN